MESKIVDISLTQLPQLIQELVSGEEIILTKDNKPIAKVVPINGDTSEGGFGSGKDEILFVADDFDEIPEGFEEYIR